ncbi:MAG TPA: ergothioneine biosynthesis protein EgtB [Rhodanobacteraceae bacterium]|nr:ergothioneine biosynthesis protein EgtB [Rhodanobacteraceae bacterium]
MNASRYAVGASPVGSASPFQRYGCVRAATLAWCAGLQPEDTVVQSMPDASPVKWHLAHTTWFFEQFLLARQPGYTPLHPQWQYLFNSYYQSVGPMHARAQRGLLSRPTLAEVLDYRARIDERMGALLERGQGDAEIAALLELGLNHEQQHQELLLTDIKHLFSLNPLQPAFRARAATASVPDPVPLRFLRGREGIVQIGHDGEGFAFDNESPRHRVLLHAHALANRATTNAEYRAFIEDGGYRTPTLWLSEGWDAVQREGWSRPLYWNEGLESEFTLAGVQPIEDHAPVCHVSFYEADAFARWAGARLPLESEWETVAQDSAVEGNFADADALHPLPARGDADTPMQMFGDAWEWTSSPYVAYPGYRPAAGAVGEYNGKFMCGQWVLRGGSCATPAGHARASYRNFFYPAARWQFSGIRLGKDA